MYFMGIYKRIGRQKFKIFSVFASDDVSGSGGITENTGKNTLGAWGRRNLD